MARESPSKPAHRFRRVVQISHAVERALGMRRLQVASDPDAGEHIVHRDFLRAGGANLGRRDRRHARRLSEIEQIPHAPRAARESVGSPLEVKPIPEHIPIPLHEPPRVAIGAARQGALDVASQAPRQDE